MGKIFTLAFILAFNICTEEDIYDDIPLERPTMDLIKSTQNSDGSWGDKNKVYCSSIVLMYLASQGESITSREFGSTVQKGLQYIVKVDQYRNDLDYFAHLWALAESYHLTDSFSVKNAIDERVDLIEDKFTEDFKTKPEIFFFQSLAIAAAFSAGFEDEILIRLRDEIKVLKAEDSLSLMTAQSILRFYNDLSLQQVDMLKEGIVKNQESPLIDTMLSKAFYFHHPTACRDAVKSKTSTLDSEAFNYKFPSSYSKKEQQLLNSIYKQYNLISFYYPRFKYTWKIEKKVKPIKSDDSELDLVD